MSSSDNAHTLPTAQTNFARDTILALLSDVSADKHAIPEWQRGPSTATRSNHEKSAFALHNAPYATLMSSSHNAHTLLTAQTDFDRGIMLAMLSDIYADEDAISAWLYGQNAPMPYRAAPSSDHPLIFAATDPYATTLFISKAASPSRRSSATFPVPRRLFLAELSLYYAFRASAFYCPDPESRWQRRNEDRLTRRRYRAYDPDSGCPQTIRTVRPYACVDFPDLPAICKTRRSRCTPPHQHITGGCIWVKKMWFRREHTLDVYSRNFPELIPYSDAKRQLRLRSNVHFLRSVALLALQAHVLAVAPLLLGVPLFVAPQYPVTATLAASCSAWSVRHILLHEWFYETYQTWDVRHCTPASIRMATAFAYHYASYVVTPITTSCIVYHTTLTWIYLFLYRSTDWVSETFASYKGRRTGQIMDEMAATYAAIRRREQSVTPLHLTQQITTQRVTDSTRAWADVDADDDSVPPIPWLAPPPDREVVRLERLIHHSQREYMRLADYHHILRPVRQLSRDAAVIGIDHEQSSLSLENARRQYCLAHFNVEHITFLAARWMHRVGAPARALARLMDIAADTTLAIVRRVLIFIVDHPTTVAMLFVPLVAGMDSDSSSSRPPMFDGTRGGFITTASPSSWTRRRRSRCPRSVPRRLCDQPLSLPGQEGVYGRHWAV